MCRGRKGDTQEGGLNAPLKAGTPKKALPAVAKEYEEQQYWKDEYMALDEDDLEVEMNTSLEEERIEGVKAQGQKKVKLRDFVMIPKEEGGGILWNASVVLIEFFKKQLPPDHFKGKRVIELGAGVGYVGARVAAELGAHVTCTEHPEEVATLTHHVDKHMKESGAKKEGDVWVRPEGGSVTSANLLWGEEGWDPEESPVARAPDGSYDAVISCELYYDDDCHDALVWSIGRLLEQNPRAEVWSLFIQRDFSLMFFAKLDDLGTVAVHQIDDIDSLGLEDLHMHVFTSKQRPADCPRTPVSLP